MRGIVLQTQANAPPGLFGEWAALRAVALDVVRVDVVARLPDPAGYDFAAVLGSSASVVGGGSAPWVGAVIDWLRTTDAAGLPVLGICFGAQALAVALGGRAFRLQEPEIGWASVESAEPDRVPAGPWVEWHQDAFEAPAGACVLARNAFGVQAFSQGRHLAVQFHPEATCEIAIGWDDRYRHAFPLAPAAAAPAAAERLFDAFAAQATTRSSLV